MTLTRQFHIFESTLTLLAYNAKGWTVLLDNINPAFVPPNHTAILDDVKKATRTDQ